MSKEINSRTIQNLLLLEEPNNTTFIALYLDIFPSVKSRDFNIELSTISVDNIGNFVDWN
jgi:hypothetical protein